MYKGYVKIVMNAQEEAEFYLNGGVYKFDTENLNENCYILLCAENEEVVGQYKYQNGKIKIVDYPVIRNDWSNPIKPRNQEQTFAMDMLKDSSVRIKVLTGVYGSGKDYLMINAGMEFINQGVYDSIVYVRNNIEVKDTVPLGAIPGDEIDKIMPFLMPFADHVGGKEGLLHCIQRDVLVPQHLGHIRGRDIKKSIILCSEAENLTTAHVQLLLGRVGEGSALWLNGDRKQTDKEVFKRDSGLKKIVDKLQGNILFGYMNLERSERSEVARLADLLDD